MAVTLFASVMLRLHAPLALVQAPLQLVKIEAEAGVAASVTLVPPVKYSVHCVPQVTPVGLLVTVPEPAPDLVTDSV